MWQNKASNATKALSTLKQSSVSAFSSPLPA